MRGFSAIIRSYSHSTPLLKDTNTTEPTFSLKEKAKTRAGYYKFTDGIKESYESIPTEHHPLFEDNHPVTHGVTEKFSEARREGGKHYKNETEQQSEAAAREIKIRNLKKYRNELGPTTKFLREGCTAEEDEKARNRLLEHYNVPVEDAVLEPIDRAKLKNNLQIIQPSFKPGGGDLDLQSPEFLQLLEREKEKIKALPSAVQETLDDLKQTVHAFSTSPEIQKIVSEYKKAGTIQQNDVSSSQSISTSTDTLPKGSSWKR